MEPPMPLSHPTPSTLLALPFGWTILPDGTHVYRPQTRTYDPASESRVDVLDDSWLAIHPPVQGVVQWSEYAVLGDGKLRPFHTSNPSGGWLNWPGERPQTIAEVLASLPGLGSSPVPHLGTLWLEGVDGAPSIP